MLSRLLLSRQLPALRPPRSFSSAAPHKPVAPDDAAVETLSKLSYRTITVRRRVAGARERRRLARLDEKRIPGVLQSRSFFPDVLLDVPLAPLLDAQASGYLTTQSRGKVKFEGPLFTLLITPPDAGATHTWDDSPPSHGPLAVRARPMNITVHPLTNNPVGVTFVLAPPDETTRVRVPVRILNQEKCPGVKAGGWVNVLEWYVDIKVAPGVVPPLVATIDVGALGLKDRLPFEALQFDGKGEGAQLVKDGETVSTVISVV